MTTTGAAAVELPYRTITNDTGRTFRVGEDPRDLIGLPRWVPITAAWACMFMAGLLEYTWGALSGSLQSAHHWSLSGVFWLFSFYVVFESVLSHPITGWLRDHGFLKVRYAVWIGGVMCGIVAYGITAFSTNLWEAYIGYAILGGFGSGMVYSSCINIVAKWYPDMKGWRTGFVNGGWAYGSVPWIIALGAVGTESGVVHLSTSGIKTFILIQGAAMTVVMVIAAYFLKDPPKNWWPAHVDPLNWSKYSKGSLRDLKANPPALKQYTTGEMWRTPQPKWIGTQFACYVACSLFGVAYYFPFAQAHHLGAAASVAGVAGFSLSDGIFRPFYGWASQFIGRRRTMTYAYTANVVFQMLAYLMGVEHLPVAFAICAVISGGLSGANFPMTAAMTADYYGENYNAVNYSTIYSWKAIGGSFAGGVAAWVITGGFGVAHGPPHWLAGFFLGSGLGVVAIIIVTLLCKAPTVEQMRSAETRAALAAARKRRPPIGSHRPGTHRTA